MLDLSRLSPKSTNMNKSSRIQYNSSDSSTAQRFRGWLDRSRKEELPYTLLWIFTALLLTALVIISLLAQPIADDFWSLAYVPHQSALHYINDFYFNHSGRFANAIVMVMGIKIFGVLAVKMIPIVESLALTGASIWFIWQILEDKFRRLERAIMLGSAFTGVYLLVVPSVFDTLVWYTSSTVYVTSFIGIILIAAMYLYLNKRPVRHWHHYTLFGFLVFFNQGFNEPAAIIMCLIASLLLLYALIGKSKSILVTVTLWVSAVVGLATVYFSPGTHSREKSQHAAIHFHVVFIDSLHDFWFTKHTLLSWRVALIVALGLAFALTIPMLSKQMRKLIAGAGLALCVVPTYITAIATHYANSAEGGLSETRTATVPFGFLVMGLVCLAVVVAQSLPQRAKRWLPLALFIAIPFSLIVSLLPVLNIVRAEVLRDSLFRYREDSIRVQVVAHQQTVYVIPAPILLDDSQAADLSYAEPRQIDWLSAALTDYYGLRGKTIKVTNMPPAAYCLTHSGAPFWGAYTCQADAARQVQPYTYTLYVPSMK